MLRVRRCGKECYNVKVSSYILYCNQTSFVEVALPVPYGGGLQPVHPLLRGCLPLDQLPHLCMLTDGQKLFTYWITKGFLTFSCNIFKWFLISDTSSSLEEDEDENSDEVDDADAGRDFASGRLLPNVSF